ncbi:MAG: FKBP-type peptidyl-prolyl cis-trans isomerase, partial [Leptothrix sp. (in: b-proteobacteria)]
ETATDQVRVHYRGTLPNGTEFDSSYKRGQPATFPLNRVIPCWTEGLQKMKVGGKARLTCPPGIAYGAAGAGGVIPPNATLHFEVELLGVNGR